MVRSAEKNEDAKHEHALLGALRVSDVELFITSARMESLSNAAQLHHLSQSAASTAIRRVEAAFQCDLCTHERRQFRLTAEGRQLLPRLEKWVRTLKEEVATAELPPIRLVTTHAIARVAVPPILSQGTVELQLMRPDSAYAAVVQDRADLALVLDNAPWEGLVAEEVGKGSFRLYTKNKRKATNTTDQCQILLPEDQIEVLALQQRWSQLYRKSLSVKARLPSWSLIADICSSSDEIGFLPDFLALQAGLYPLIHQPPQTHYRVLALYKEEADVFQKRVTTYLKTWRRVFL